MGPRHRQEAGLASAAPPRPRLELVEQPGLLLAAGLVDSSEVGPSTHTVTVAKLTCGLRTELYAYACYRLFWRGQGPGRSVRAVRVVSAVHAEDAET